MKACPCKIEDYAFVECDIKEATHLAMNSYGHFPRVRIPITADGIRPKWDWNGDIEKPTIKPSILTRCNPPSGSQVCHCFITDGTVQFLSDSTHEFAGRTLELKDITFPL